MTILLMSSLRVGIASARTWHVRASGAENSATIQAGIDGASNGDTVLVAPGVYYENIIFKGKNIVLTSSGGPAVTTIDGHLGTESCVRITNGEGASTELIGFTLTGGTGSAWTPGGAKNFGGGIIIVGAEPTICGNVISSNSSDTGGGGIWCGGSDLITVWNPVIRDNVLAANHTGILGGAIGVAGNCAPVIRANVVEENSVADGDGGGVAILARISGARVEANYFRENVAGDHGGAVYVGATVYDLPEVEILGNVLAGNEARGIGGTGDSGGGIWVGGIRAWIHHNTLVSNAGRGGTGNWGGGIAVARGDALIEGNIIALALEGGGIRCNGDGVQEIRNNLAWNNVGGAGSGSCVGWQSTLGNIDADPLFCDPEAGDYSVSMGSPAITGPIVFGAIPAPACNKTPVAPTTWGQLKQRFGR